MKVEQNAITQAHEVKMEWGEMIQLTLPDGSHLSIETSAPIKQVYMLGVPSLGHRISKLGVVGDLGILPLAFKHPVTGEIVNEHEGAKTFTAVFGHE